MHNYFIVRCVRNWEYFALECANSESSFVVFPVRVNEVILIERHIWKSVLKNPFIDA